MAAAALEIQSPNGLSYRERLEHARTEKDLSELFEDFIGSVPLGERLFGDWNPVRTGGPMQVSIEFAEKQAKEKHYPYAVEGNIHLKLLRAAAAFTSASRTCSPTRRRTMTWCTDLRTTTPDTTQVEKPPFRTR